MVTFSGLNNKGPWSLSIKSFHPLYQKVCRHFILDQESGIAQCIFIQPKTMVLDCLFTTTMVPKPSLCSTTLFIQKLYDLKTFWNRTLSITIWPSINNLWDKGINVSFLNWLLSSMRLIDDLLSCVFSTRSITQSNPFISPDRHHSIMKIIHTRLKELMRETRESFRQDKF